MERIKGTKIKFGNASFVCKNYNISNNNITYETFSNDIYKLNIKNKESNIICKDQQYHLSF